MWNIELDLEAKELSRNSEDIRLPELISIIIIKLFPTLFIPTMHAPDRLITYHLPHTKIITILLLQEGLIMALHYNYEYRVLKL